MPSMLLKWLESFDTAPNSELLTSIPMDNNQHVLQALEIGPLMAGDRCIIHGYQQLTNNNTKDAWCGYGIVLSTTPDLTGRFLTVTPPSGTNITNTDAIHHYTQGRSRGVTIASAQPVAYALLVATGASSYLPTTATFKVDVGSGYISVDIFRSGP